MTITRFAPSPTGHLHLGNLRSCFLNWVFAKKNNGKFILRYDDTDQERSREEFIVSIASDLKWLNIDYDETFYQSKRIERYNEKFDSLISKNFVYPCFESNEDLEIKKKLQLKAGKPPIYDRESLHLSKEEIEKKILNGENPHWRFKLSQSKISWNDLVKGMIEVDLSSQSDPVLRRADGSYLYHFPSVVDDIDMKITHIIRGEDHLSNSAVHNELFQSLESAPPLFGHNPLMLNEDGTKLSKRNFDSISITQFKAKGYTTNSILSYLYSVGLNTDVNFKEVAINSFADFDLSKISKNLPKLDIQKINHFQKNSLRAMDINDIKNEFSKLEDLGITEKEWNLIKDNIEIYENIIELLDIVRRKKIEIAPNKEFIKLLKNNISEIKDLKFDDYISFLIEKDNKLSKKDIFTNTRFILTGNNNGPSVKDLYLFFGFSGLERILNEFETL
jgi:glutamyl-tRNA synthetase